MQPTAKWNEELPLAPKRPQPAPKRYAITLDNGRPVMVTIAPQGGSPRKALPLLQKKIAEIKGASLRDDELMEDAHENSDRTLVVDKRGNIHRPGENISPAGVSMSMRGESFFPPTYVGSLAPTFPGGIVVSRAKLRAMAANGQLKKPNNLVNSFRSGKLRHRKGNFPKGLTREAIAVSNPGAYHGLVIPPSAAVNGAVLARGLSSGAIVMGHDGSVYARTESGFLKKIGKVVKKTASVATKVATTPVKATIKVTANVANPVARGITTVAKPMARTVATAARATSTAAKATAAAAKKTAVAVKKTAVSVSNAAVAAGKLTARGIVEVARLVSSVSAQPIRLAFAVKIGRPRAKAIARSRGRQNPNAQDKQEAVNWGFGKVKQKMGPLGTMTVEILKFSRGASLSGASRAESILQAADMGFDPATISAYAAAITAALASLSKALNFVEGLKNGGVTAEASVQIPQAEVQQPDVPAMEVPAMEAPADPYPYSPTEYVQTPTYEAQEYPQQQYYETQPTYEDDQNASDTSGNLITFGCYERRR